MKTNTEFTDYLNKLFADIEIAWSCLRDAVMALVKPAHQQRLLSPIEQAMRWDTGHDISKLNASFFAVKQLIEKENLWYELEDWVNDLDTLLTELTQALQLKQPR